MASYETIHLCRHLTTLFLVSTCTTALAQGIDPATAVNASASDEIVVTAQKRTERLQDVPVSVSVFGGDALAKSKVTQVDELVGRVPNLQLTSTVGDNTPIFALRGVSMSDYSLNQASPIATYYDEVYKGNFAFLGLAMYDLERVEVLRGPQGTLYGKNTTGGAVNLISRAPKLNETSGYANIGYGNYNRVDLNGAINAPLGDKAALRIAGTYAKADGWFKNVIPGQPDLAGTSEYGIRASLLLEPADGVKFVLGASTSFQNPTNYGIYAQPEATNRPNLTQFQIASNVPDKRRARTYSVALTSTFDIGSSLAITSVTSWDKGSLSFKEDTDGTATKLLEIPYTDRANQFAQDLRLSSDFKGPFNFILGAYFNREKVFNETTFQIATEVDFDGKPGEAAADCVIGFPLACQFRNSFDQVKKSYAIYSDASFEITDHLKLRGGLRFTHDTGAQNFLGSDALGADSILVKNLIPSIILQYKTNNFSGKIGFDYKMPGSNLAYINYSRGYRGNSFNAQAFFDPSEVSIAKPETIDAFEIGAKTRFSDHRITLNMAAFYYKYTNQQFINIDPATAAQTLINIPESRIYGGEAELSARATDWLSLRGGLGLLSTSIRKGTVSGVNVIGNRLSNAPKINFTGGFDTTVMNNTSGKLSLHGDLSYASNQYFEVLNVPRLNQGGYALASGHIDWQSADGRWNASIWGKNLTQKFYFTSRVDLLSGFGFDYNHIGTPRTFGVSGGIKF